MPTNPTSGKMCWKHGWMEFAEAYAQHRLDIFPNPSPEARRERPKFADYKVASVWLTAIDAYIDSLEAELAALKAQPDGWIAGFEACRALSMQVVDEHEGYLERISDLVPTPPVREKL